MTFEMHLKRIVSTASRFIKTKGGNVAPMFAFAALPILAATGAAIDYTRAVAARSAMQAAVDSTALMLAQDAATLTPADLNIKAQAYFNALYTNSEVAGITVAAAYTANTGNGATVLVTSQGNMSTEFMKLVGYTMVPLNVASTSTWGNTKLRVAIALDVTGSMNDDGKLPAMQTAAKNLIDSLRSSAKATGDVFVSIVPFNQMVNVDPANKNASWVDITTDYGVCTNSNGNTNNTYKTKVTCTNAGKTWTSSNLNSWTGCVWDRGSNTPTTNDYDTTKTVPTTTTPTTLYQVKNYSSCPAKILPMMSIYAASDAQIVKDKIGALVAAGNTNQAIGMHWAWMSLQQTLPLNSPAKDVNIQYTDAIILLSDGLNTQDRWYTSATSIDNRQKTLCDTIKDPTNGKTVIYTIQVNTSGDAESAVLKYCANTGNFYPTTTTSGIANAFNQIGTSLMKLRIAH